MKIAFLTRYKSNDINVWSGTLFHLFQTLNVHHKVEWVGENMLEQITAYQSENFVRDNDKIDCGRYAPILGRLLSEYFGKSDYDLIFLGDLYYVPFLDVSIPIVHLSDTTFNLFKNYLGISNEERIKSAETLEKKYLEKASVLLYSSEWAKQNAVSYYGVDPGKIHVIELGANIPDPVQYQENIDTSRCNLLFIGRNWKKKGGDKVLEAYQKLKKEGFSCTLTIIGSLPPLQAEEDKDLTIIPFLDKSKQEDLERLCKILYDTHFLVLPTEFDAYGIVFCEASAYGVPSIAADVGGVSQPLCDGKNGYLLSSEATATDYAEKIKTVFNDKEGYLKLRASSRAEFETRLNWTIWYKKVNKVIEELVSNHNQAE